MHCPHCGELNDGQTNITSERQPYPGAAALCFYCCEYGIFDKDEDQLYIRRPTAMEKSELSLDRDAQNLRRELISYKASRWN